MVLKRKLPSQLAKEKADKATQDVADNSPVVTDFETSPDSFDDRGESKTDKFTADALKEAANALAAEMGTPSTADIYLNDPFEDIDDVPLQRADAAKVEPSQHQADALPVAQDEAPEVIMDPFSSAEKTPTPLKDTFADILPQDVQAKTEEKDFEEKKVDAELEKVSDAVGDIDEKPKEDAQTLDAQKPSIEKTEDAQLPNEASSGKSFSAPERPAGLKRKNRNKRKRARLATNDSSDTHQDNAPIASQEKPKNTDTQQEDKPDDMELAAQYKPDENQTKTSVDRAFKEMAGVPDPAEQEIEAAYIPPAEVEPEAVYNAPKPDISKMLSEEKDPVQESKIEPKIEPEKKSNSKVDLEAEQENALEAEIQMDDAKKTKASEEPKAKVESEPQTETVSDEKEQEMPSEVKAKEAIPEKAKESTESTPPPSEKKKAVTPPAVSFAEPQSFAEISEKDKKLESLPWEQEADTAENEDGGWELDLAPDQVAPTPDVYGDMGGSKKSVPDASENASEPVEEEPKPDSKGKKPAFAMPFLNKLKNATADTPTLPTEEMPQPKKDGDDLSPPELPTNQPIKKKAFDARPLLLLAALGVVSIIGYKLLSNKDSTQERVARFTGALDNTPETLPSPSDTPEGTTSGTQNSIQPQQVITQEELARLNKELEEDLARLNPSESDQTPSSNAQIDFVDVTKEEANKPIVAEADEPLPGEKGFVASLQDAISSEREKRGMTTNKDATPAADQNAQPEDRRIESLDMQAQVQAELEAYRKALSSSDSDLPIKPNQFFGTVNEQGVLLPPKVRRPAGDANLPESEIYTDNPYNLPVLAEPEAEPTPTVRSLNDFDVAMFEPPKAKVRIPQGLKPRLRASDFPEITALSFVPNKGMIAHANGREGVLLIGEVIEGWELFSVTANHAEFRSGQRKYYVNLD